MHASMNRRCLLAASLATALLAGPTAAWAQKSGYPNRPVKVIVPFVPGGNADSTARIFSDALGQYLGQPFVVDNRGGAGGMIGALQMVRSPADGYHLMIGTTAPIVSSWQMAGKAAGYSIADMKPVALLTQVPGVIVVNAASRMKSFADLVADAQARPGDFKFGHPGNGTAGHVNILQLQKALAQDFIIAGYKGAGPAVQELLGGRLDAVATDLPSALQLVRGGKLRALAVVFAQRAPALPDVATMAELKRPEVNIAPFTAMMAPRDVPAPIIARLMEASRATVADSAVRKRVEAIGGVPTAMDSVAFEKFLAEQTRTYRDLVESGLLTSE